MEIEIKKDKFGVKKFIINKEKGAVVCILSSSRLNREYGEIIEFVGKAKVSPEDKFDVEKGKAIAQRRAEFKFYKRLRREMKEDIKYYEQRVIELENLIRFNRKHINTATKHILDLAIKQSVITNELKELKK